MVNYTYEYYQEGGRAMGQTDVQFKAFIRFVLDALEAVEQEQNPERKQRLFDKIKDNLQKTLED